MRADAPPGGVMNYVASTITAYPAYSPPDSNQSTWVALINPTTHDGIQVGLLVDTGQVLGAGRRNYIFSQKTPDLLRIEYTPLPDLPGAETHKFAVIYENGVATVVVDYQGVDVNLQPVALFSRQVDLSWVPTGAFVATEVHDRADRMMTTFFENAVYATSADRSPRPFTNANPVFSYSPEINGWTRFLYIGPGRFALGDSSP